MGMAQALDTQLSPFDWVFCLLCGGIACIFGFVYAFQGKPKGMKMVLVSVAATIFWSVVRVLIQMASEQGEPGFP